MAVSSSIEWSKYKFILIRDIHEKFRDQVRDYVLQHLCSHELYKVLGLPQEPEIHQELQAFLKHILKNDCSVVALDSETDTIYAVALVKWMSEEWRSWTALRLILNSPRLLELLEMLQCCLEAYAKATNETWNSLHLFYYHVAEDLMKDGCFLQRFFQAICEVARHMKMPRVTYMALTQRNRDVIELQGFKETSRVIYSMYISKGRRPFDHLRDIDELYAAVYEKKVDAVRSFKELAVRHGGDLDLKDNKRMTKLEGEQRKTILPENHEED